MKAITITSSNIEMLASRFAVDPEDFTDVLPLGYVLVCEFGVDEHFDTLTTFDFNELFDTTGDILNGFVSIEWK